MEECELCGKATHCGMRLCNYHYNIKHRERIRIYAKGWRERNKKISSIKNKKWRIENKERLASQSKIYQLKNKDKISERQKEYYEKNKEIKAIKSKEYRERNAEILKIKKSEYGQRPEVKARRKNKSKTKDYRIRKKISDNKYAKKNRDKLLVKKREYRKKNLDIINIKRKLPETRASVRKYVNKRMKTHPNIALTQRLRQRLRAAFNYYTKNGKIMTSKKYGIDYNKIIEHLKPFPEDLSKYHIDHIKPLCTFNLENPEDVRKAFSPENHQWLLAFDNHSKGGRYVYGI